MVKHFREIHEKATDLKLLKVKNITFETDGATGSLKDSDGTDIKCDGKIKVDIGGTTYYIPVYDSTA